MKADLHDAELDELEGLLAQAPQPLEPLDVVSMDGYLCAVAVQPRIVPTAEWMPRLLDSEGSRWPPAHLPAPWMERVQALAVRRFEAIVRGLAEDGHFDPVVSVMPEPAPEGGSGADQEAGSLGGGEPAADSGPAGQTEPAADTGPAGQTEPDPLAEVPVASRPLVSWASGFLYGCEVFEALLDQPDDAVHLALSHILRHLPPMDDEERQIQAALDATHPLHDEDDAIAQTVDAAATLWKLTAQDRLSVKTMRREGPKVGRNDPCPCGSGRKFKQCHGRG